MTILKNFALEKFDVFVQAGQSNSMGCSFKNASKPYAESDLVWYLNPDFTISIAHAMSLSECDNVFITRARFRRPRISL